MDTERYCEETQPHDADCEDNFAKTGITVLLVYQATQMLTAWAAWRLLVLVDTLHLGAQLGEERGAALILGPPQRRHLPRRHLA